MDMDVTIMKLNFNAQCALQYCAPYKKYMLPSTKGFLINGAFDPRHWHRHARRHLHLELLRPLAWLGIVQFQKLFAICLGGRSLPQHGSRCLAAQGIDISF